MGSVTVSAAASRPRAPIRAPAPSALAACRNCRRERRLEAIGRVGAMFACSFVAGVLPGPVTAAGLSVAPCGGRYLQMAREASPGTRSGLSQGKKQDAAFL